MENELLAPAGNFNCLKSAIAAGADAVYFGCDEFNARANVENFNRENLRQAVKLAHLHGVKMYMALNILFSDKEIEKVLQLVRFARDCKVDAFIVQDIGVASLLKESFPKIELHASTQMGISTLEGAHFLKNIGFSRIVLARETELSEIKRIKDNLDIQLEYFVQGALCVGYSGNCYLSSLVEGASGNRGKCKQLCRLPYEMKYKNLKKRGYLLSAKDLCMLPVLKELAQAGIYSFKIEGRARREGYVAGAVQTYRRVLDDNYKSSDGEIIKLKYLFNRGNFACGYLKQEKMIYPQNCGHIGVEIGKVDSFKKGKRFNEVVITSSHAVTRGDLLQFIFKDGTVEQISVYDVKAVGENKYYITTTNIISKDAKVSLLVNSKLEQKLVNMQRKIPVVACFTAMCGERPKLQLSAGAVTIEVVGENSCQKAQSQPLSESECFSQLAKLGENFLLEKLDFCSDGVFIRKAEINQLRRDASVMLEEKIIEHNEKYLSTEYININKNKEKLKENGKKIIIYHDFNQLIKNINSSDEIIYSPEIYREEEIKQINEVCDKIIYLDFPPYVRESDLKLINKLLSYKNIGVVANNYYAINLTTPDKTIIGSELNVSNSLSIEFYRKLGFSKIILSKEDFCDFDIKNKEGLFLHDGVKEKLIYFKHCPIKEHIGGDCGSCRFCEGISYSLAGRRYQLRRIKLKNCLFYLEMMEKRQRNHQGFGEIIKNNPL